MPGDERFAGTLCIPYVTARNDVIALKFRRITGEGPKYDGPSGQKQHLYNARALVDGGEVAIICEGELDTVMAAQTFGVPCVGTPGTNWLPHWSRCFGDFDRVVILADNDEKDDGSNPGRKHALAVQKHVPGSDVIYPPAGMDLTDWVLSMGVDAVKGAVGV